MPSGHLGNYTSLTDVTLKSGKLPKIKLTTPENHWKDCFPDLINRGDNPDAGSRPARFCLRHHRIISVDDAINFRIAADPYREIYAKDVVCCSERSLVHMNTFLGVTLV